MYGIIILDSSILITGGVTMRVIQGKKSRDKYFYDEEKMTVSDKEGNTIKLYVDFNDISESDLVWFLDSMFHKFYKLTNEFKDDCLYSKNSDIEWREFK